MPKSFLLLVMAAGCGLVAMLGLRQFIPKDGDAKPKSIKVLIAKKDIRPYIPLSDEFVGFEERPADQVPIGAVQTFAQYDRRALRQAAVKGEVILTSKLGEKDDFNASAVIPPGYRVFTVPITATTSHSGQIRPGDRVDVFVTYNSKDNPSAVTGLMKAKMILDYVQVFAMGADRSSDSAADDQILAKNASLLVTPQQVMILQLAESKGSLSLALRSQDDDQTVELDDLDEVDFDKIGTEYSAREALKQEYEKKMTDLENSLTDKYEKQLAELDDETAQNIQQTVADLQQKFVDEQKRRDDLHAQTLAGLEAKNVELQTLLEAAIADSSNKEALAKRLQALQTENKSLEQLLADARKRAESQRPLEVKPIEVADKKWIIEVYSGKSVSRSEFDVKSEELGDQSKDKKSNDSQPIEEETSTKYSPKNENTAPESPKLLRTGS